MPDPIDILSDEEIGGWFANSSMLHGNGWGELKPSAAEEPKKELLGAVCLLHNRDVISEMAGLSTNSGDMIHPVFDDKGNIRFPNADTILSEMNVSQEGEEDFARFGGIFEPVEGENKFAFKTREEAEETFVAITRNPEAAELIKNRGLVIDWLASECENLANRESMQNSNEQNEARIAEIKSTIRGFTKLLKGMDPIDACMEDNYAMYQLEHYSKNWLNVKRAGKLEYRAGLGARGCIEDSIENKFRWDSDPSNHKFSGMTEDEVHKKAQENRARAEALKPMIFKYIEEAEKELGQDLG
jgi:hypothetical protein